MSALAEIYNLIDETDLVVIDDFTDDTLVLEHRNEHGTVTFTVGAEYPDDVLQVRSDMTLLDNDYINQMLKVQADQTRGNSAQLQLTLDELINRLLPELLDEQTAIAEGRKLKSAQKTNEKPEIKFIPKKPAKTRPTMPQKEKKSKLKMKTVTDVVNRIQWDEQLKPADFIVGYHDRFTGIQEKSFDDFTWKNIVDVDYVEVFGVPEHRVMYFKYLNEKVWDRASRVDHVFGSAEGKGLTIDEIIIKQQQQELSSVSGLASTKSGTASDPK